MRLYNCAFPLICWHCHEKEYTPRSCYPSSLSPRGRQWSRDAPAKLQTHSLKQSCPGQSIVMGLQNKCTEILRLLYSKSWLKTLTTSYAWALMHTISVMPHITLWGRDGKIFILQIMKPKLGDIEQLVQNPTVKSEFKPSSLASPLWPARSDCGPLLATGFTHINFVSPCLILVEKMRGQRREFIFFLHLSPGTLIQNLIYSGCQPGKRIPHLVPVAIGEWFPSSTHWFYNLDSKL